MDFKKEYKCSCGRVHNAAVDDYVIEKGAVKYLPAYIKKYGARKPFAVFDVNTFSAAGEAVCKVLESSGMEYGKYVFESEHLEPNENALGSLMMHYDTSCDIIVAVGSGVINDLCKLLAKISGHCYIIVATAPSMDGYASVTSSVIMDGLKYSIGNRCANVIIGDIDILKNAPERMLTAGLGDVLAKYISIADWRIAHIVTEEYYCENVADMVRQALKRCVDNCELLLKRDDGAVKAVFEALILSGVAMNYAQVTRVASGVEHSISHIWDMRGEEFKTATELHGIQCAIGTLYAARIYDMLRRLTPDAEKARKFVSEFDFDTYSEKLREYMGRPAEGMIAKEAIDGKYRSKAHAVRLGRMLDNWDEIQTIINDEVPTVAEIERILDAIKCPKSSDEIGIPTSELPMTYAATKDIRDKYVQSRVCFDLGIIDDIKF